MSSDGGSVESLLRVDAIPVIDLRFISQDELNCLADIADDLRHLRRDDLVVPKIDRSVFNESAGSRRQTYSRLRLAQKKDDAGVVGGGRRRTGLISISRQPANQFDDSDNRDDERIVALLRHMFANDGSEHENRFLPTVSDFAKGKEIRAEGTASRDESLGLRKRKRRRKHDARTKFQNSSSQSIHGVDSSSVAVSDGAVDVFPLASEDVIVAELGKRTVGLVTEFDVFGFLDGLPGRWASRRKRKKFVDGVDFGNVLPEGWKILFGIRRKHGKIFVDIRKYISPSGRQFITDKKVFSDLMSSLGQHYPSHSSSVGVGAVGSESNKSSIGKSIGFSASTGSDQQIASLALNLSAPCEQDDLDGSYKVKNPVKDELRSLLECLKCKVSFQKKDEFVQHLATFHQGSMKYCKPSKTIGKGVIIKDGKYECQFCHKVFQERHRYNGHVGVHVRLYAKSLETLPDEITLKNVDQLASVGVTSIAHDDSSMGKCNVVADSASLLSNDEHVSYGSSLSDSDEAGGCKTEDFVPKDDTTKLVYGTTASEAYNDLNNDTSVDHSIVQMLHHFPNSNGSLEGCDNLNSGDSVDHSMNLRPKHVPNSNGLMAEGNDTMGTLANTDDVLRSNNHTLEEKDRPTCEFLGRLDDYQVDVEKKPGNDFKEIAVKEISTLSESGLHGCLRDTGIDSRRLANEPAVGGDEENKMHSELINLPSIVEQPSEHMSVNKVECEAPNVEAKLEMLSGLEEMPLNDNVPLVFEPMDLAYGVELVDEMEAVAQPSWDAVLPTLANEQLTTLCIWCRAEFSYEGINPETHPDSVGFMCPTCKLKISGQLDVFDDGSAK